MKAHTRMALALVLGLAAGMLPVGKSWAPVFEPIGSLWVNAIRMPVIPLVVSLIIGAISSADGLGVGRLAARAMALFLLSLSGFVAIATLVTPLLLRPLTLDPAGSEALRAAAGVDPAALRGLTPREWLVSLVPTNPFKAAADGALLPLMLFGVLYALAVARLEPERRRTQARFFQGVADAMLTVIRWVVAIAPVGVFALAWGLGSHLGRAAVGAIGYYIVVDVALVVAAGVALYLVTMLVGRVPLRRLQEALFPAQALAVGARSSLAALPLLIDGARGRLRLPEPVVGLVLPLGASLFKVGAAVTWPIGALLVARLYGIDLSGAKLVAFAVGTVALSLSSPGIPSGGFLIQAPLYTAVGLPPEGLGILIAIDLVPDLFKGPLNVTGYLSAATVVARLEGWSGGNASPPERVETG